MENPNDPTKTKYEVSFKAVFYGARKLLDLAVEGSKNLDQLMLRFHASWGSILATASVFSAVMLQVKVPTYATEAFDALSELVTLFENTKAHPIPEHSIVCLSL